MRILTDLRANLLQAIPGDLVSTRGTFVGWQAVQFIRAAVAAERKISEKDRVAALQVAQPVLEAALRIPHCYKWTNGGYCPDSPWGNYWWAYSYEMIQELLWQRPEFRAGYRYGRGLRRRGGSWRRGERARDANPYDDGARHDAWDHGYILGLVEPRKLRRWVEPTPEAVAEAVRIVRKG